MVTAARERPSGQAVLIGLPNAGKSTLLNCLAGRKVSSVTHKAQTTRRAIPSRIGGDSAGLTAIDTPGLTAGGRIVRRAWHNAARGAAAAADILVLVVDAARARHEGAQALARQFFGDGAAQVIVLNKIDRLARPRLLALAEEWTAIAPQARIFMVSARRGDGVEDLKAHLAAIMPEEKKERGVIAPLSEQEQAEEITREKIFLRLHDEIPYETGIHTESWESGKGGSLRIRQVIEVARASQKAMVIGAQGQCLRAIGEAARREMKERFGRAVHLFLFVRLRRNSRRKERGAG